MVTIFLNRPLLLHRIQARTHSNRYEMIWLATRPCTQEPAMSFIKSIGAMTSLQPGVIEWSWQNLWPHLSSIQVGVKEPSVG